MTRTIFAATGVCALITAALSAQTTPTQPAQPAAPGRMGTPQNMTMTGCLKPWDASTMGAPMTGAPAATADRGMAGAAGAQQFVLTNATQGAATATALTPGGAMGTPAPAGSGAAMGAHTTYLLKAQTPSIDLAAHAGHKVEVTGMVAMDASNSMGAKPGTTGTGAMGTSGATTGAMGTTPGAAGTTPTTPGSTATAPGTATTAGAAGMAQQHGAMAAGNSTFTVTALKMIDKTCS